MRQAGFPDVPVPSRAPLQWGHRIVYPLRARSFSAAMALIIGVLAHGQGVFFQAGFTDGTIPPAFSTGPDVERLGPDGQGLGEFVSAWRVMNAAEANSGGFFPVPDVPVANRFIAANDDAFPCDCDMAEVTLTITPPTFAGRSGIALECRVFHERTLGGGDAYLEVRTGGGIWNMVDTLPVVAGGWQQLFFDLSAYDGLDGTQLRFRWGDGGTWASGFAVDDIVLRERANVDLAVERSHTHNVAASPFTPGDQSLRYRLLPLAQAAPFVVSAEVVNRGRQSVDGIQAEATIRLNGIVQGVFHIQSPEALAPGERRLVVVPTGWVPDATGPVEVVVAAQPAQSDDEPANNSASASMRITGPGWGTDYGAMARDEGGIEGSLGGRAVYIAANRFEAAQPGSVRGISAVISTASEEGAWVRGILFDANLALIDTTTRFALTAEHLAAAEAGEPLYLAFSAPVEVGVGDLIAGIQHLDTATALVVHTGGNSPIGAALYMTGQFFDVEYLWATPMVRLHVDDYGVGVEEGMDLRPMELSVFPVPSAGPVRVRFTLERPTAVDLALLDAQGRTVGTTAEGTLAAGTHERVLDTTALAPGAYLLHVRAGGAVQVGRLLVARH